MIARDRLLLVTETLQPNEETKNPPSYSWISLIRAFSDKDICQHYPNLELQFADNRGKQGNAVGGAKG